MSDKIILAEPPFVGFQGEGSTTGQLALFIRFTGCNLSCTFCDSKFSWKSDEMTRHEYSMADIQGIIDENDRVGTIIFTGGEPFLPANLKHMMRIINANSEMIFEVETNGTILPDSDIMEELDEESVKLNISPKINVIQHYPVDTDPILLDWVNEGINYVSEVNYKFLFESVGDIHLIEGLRKGYRLPLSDIWVQPCGTDADTLRKTIIDCEELIIKSGFNLSVRTHVFVFGDQLGK